MWLRSGKNKESNTSGYTDNTAMAEGGASPAGEDPVKSRFAIKRVIFPEARRAQPEKDITPKIAPPPPIIIPYLRDDDS